MKFRSIFNLNNLKLAKNYLNAIIFMINVYTGFSVVFRTTTEYPALKLTMKMIAFQKIRRSPDF